MKTMVLEPEDLGYIGTLAKTHAPREVCGVILPYKWRGERVFQVPNRAEDPLNHFEMHSEDIVERLEEWLAEAGPFELNSIALWHTHPRGQVGPSENDLNNRINECVNLVVSITDAGVVPTFY